MAGKALPAAIDWTRFPLDMIGGSDPVIRWNYRYYVEVDLYNGLSYFGGIRITCTPLAP